MTPNTLRPIGYDDILNLVPERLAMESDEWLRDKYAQSCILQRCALIARDRSGYRRNVKICSKIMAAITINATRTGGRP